MHSPYKFFTKFFIVCTKSSHQNSLAWDNIRCCSRIKCAKCQNRTLSRWCLTCDQVLKCTVNVKTNVNWIDTKFRHCSMTAISMNGNLESVTGRGHITKSVIQGWFGRIQHNMHADSSINFWIFQDSGSNQLFGSCKCLLSRLEHEFYTSAQFIAVFIQHLSCT